MQTAMNRPQNPHHPFYLHLTTHWQQMGVLIITKSKEQENKTCIVLTVFTYTKNIKNGQSDCTCTA